VIAAYAITAGLLFGVALYGVLSRRGLIQRLLAANVMTAAVFLYLIVLAAGHEDGTMDAVPQAMVLTGLVIAVSVTAFALALVRWFRDQTGHSTLEDDAAAWDVDAAAFDVDAGDGDR
jgi:multicomponent Na+:H+ antiporter subunit C